MSEEEISMVLNTFMYLDYKEADDGMNMTEILAELSSSPDCREGGIHYGEYQVLSQAADNPEIGNLIIGNQSHLMGYDTGTAACSFSSSDGNCIYIVYRGTGDGEWPDNGRGMTSISTTQQERALSYFETVVERENIDQTGRLIVTGHSKGGNKAQYVTMSTKYHHLLDACYNVDGQGFSEEAISAWKGKWGEEGFQSRRGKITGIYGENDYVNVLGYGVVPKENIYYIKTPIDKGNFAGYHDIKYMFATRRKNPHTGEWETVFSGSPNDYAMARGKLGNYAAELSASMMELPGDKRDGCAAFLMQIMEITRGSKSGINGEKLTFPDVYDFWEEGIPAIKNSLFMSAEGLFFLDAAIYSDSFATEMQGNVNFMFDDKKLLAKAKELEWLALRLETMKAALNEVTGNLGQVMIGSFGIKTQLEIEEMQLKKAAKKVRKLSEKLYEVIRIYQKKDEAAAGHMCSG